jgi:3-oxoacyl-[acyl-carrier protein] reductase
MREMRENVVSIAIFVCFVVDEWIRLDRNMDLEGKNALVTGGSRGIGRAIALALARAGAGVAVNYVSNREAADSVVGEIEACGVKALALQADVRNIDEVRSMHKVAKEALGAVDILVNNAGILKDNLVTFMKDDEWSDVIDVDLKGPFHCIKVIGRDMVRRKSGKIINISSDAGLMGDLMRANYSAAKAGLIGLTKTVAREFSPSGVNVNAVAPGIIQTGMTEDMGSSREQKQLASIPMSRFGTAEEVAAAVLFLASSDADYITGQVLCVDGGMHT